LIRFGVMAVIAIVLFAGYATRAAADGDPASDFLVGADVYLPFPVPSAKAGAALVSEVKSVYSAGYWIKVAVIATKSDLGSIPSLMGHPVEYARFLGSELSSIYVGPLLIVMPTGLGFYDGGRSIVREQGILNGFPVRHSQGADGLTRAATSVVAALLSRRVLKSKDISAPIAYPQPSLGRRGHVMKLDYQVTENSERSSVNVEVLAGTNKVASFAVRSQRVTPQATYSVQWDVPPTLPPGPFTVCVSARDSSGNHGPLSCTVIQIS
jgi:hypothetical protein